MILTNFSQIKKKKRRNQLIQRYQIVIGLACFLGSGPNRAQSPVEWGEIPSVCLYVCPLWQALKPSGRPSDPLDRGRVDQWNNGWADGWAYGRMEFLPILQHFVPCRGRCPATF